MNLFGVANPFAQLAEPDYFSLRSNKGVASFDLVIQMCFRLTKRISHWLKR